MSLKAALPHSNGGHTSLSIPGKIFLLGEYAVLSDIPAIVAAVGPRFFGEISSKSLLTQFHSESPAGKLYAQSGSIPSFGFHDPYAGAGGFGASTAQFALALKASREELSVWEVYDLYRKLTHVPEFPPSGADLVAQWIGGVCYFNAKARDVSPLWAGFFENVIALGASNQKGRKVATHNHLPELSKKGVFSADSPWLVRLRSLVEDGACAIRANDATKFGRTLTAYGDTLAEEGLQIEPTAKDREAFSKIPGVLGVKGAGALQADALVLVIEPSARAKVLELAHERRLNVVADGLKKEEGVRWD